MRQPVKRTRRVPDPRTGRSRREEFYCGAIRYKGKDHWVTDPDGNSRYKTPRDWQRAAVRLMDVIDERALAAAVPAALTVARFCNIELIGRRWQPIDPVRETWPWSHPARRKAPTSFERAAEAARQVVRTWGEREFDSVTHVEAMAWARGVSPAVRGYARQIWSDAIRDRHATYNPFERTGLPARSSRLDDPDFRIVTQAELDLLIEAAWRSRADDYGLVLKAMVLFEAHTGIRPGELFAAEWAKLQIKGEVTLYQIDWQIDDKRRKRPPKYNSRRMIALPRMVVEAIKAMPRLHETYLFCGPAGEVLYQTLWQTYWQPIRAAAAAADRQRTGAPSSIFDDFDFYELKHRAITWMVTPRPHGAGMDVRDVATVVGHKDHGETIMRHYLRMDARQAAERMAAAFAEAEGPHLRAVS